MTSFERVASAAEAREASPQVVTVGGRTLGLFYHDGEFHAVDNRCPHMDIEIDNTPRVEVEVEKPTRVGYVDCGSEGEPLGVMVFVTADELRSLGSDPTASAEVGITVTDSGVSLSSR